MSNINKIEAFNPRVNEGLKADLKKKTNSRAVVKRALEKLGVSEHAYISSEQGSVSGLNHNTSSSNLKRVFEESSKQMRVASKRFLKSKKNKILRGVIATLSLKKFSETGLTFKEIKNFVKKGKKRKSGTSILINHGDKRVIISKIKNSQTNQKIVEIHVVVNKIFKAGSFGAIRHVVSFGTHSSRLVEKRIHGFDKKKAYLDMKKEVRNLKKIHRNGQIKGVQLAPSIVVCNNALNIEGYLGRLYDGDGVDLVRDIIGKKKVLTKPKEMINQLNCGLFSLYKMGILQGDHKLQNILFLRNKQKINVVVADLGGVVELNKLNEKLDRALQLQQKKTSGLKLSLKESDELFNLKHGMYGDYTPITNCKYDFNYYVDKLFMNLPQKSISKNAFLSELKKLLEARIIYAQGIVALCLLTGQTETDLLNSYLFKNEGFASIFNCSDLRDFKSKLMTLGLTDSLSKRQLQSLFYSLITDFKKRINLKDFVDVW